MRDMAVDIAARLEPIMTYAEKEISKLEGETMPTKAHLDLEIIRLRAAMAKAVACHAIEKAGATLNKALTTADLRGRFGRVVRP